MDIEQRFASDLARLAATRDSNSSARATLAILRRGLGKAPGDAPEMYRYVQPRIAAVPERDEDRFYLVASLFAAHQISWPAPEAESNAGPARRVDIGTSLRQFVVRKPDAAEGTERRFSALLQCDRTELPEHLRHAVSLLKSEEIPVQWAQLLRDIARWHYDGKPAQRQWARSYWNSTPQNATDTDETTTTAITANTGDDSDEKGA